MKTTIDPDLQAAAVSALAGRAGGIAVLDARNGDVRALAGQAFSAPQPPGSTFKMITTTAALQKGVVSLDDEFEITNGVNVGGRFINNANGEYCGGTFREAFAESCNADFAPLGPKIGNDDLVATAERFGFNSPPTLYAPRIVARSRTGRIDASRPKSATNSTSASARSARAKCWRRRWRWRASRRRSATAASASRPRSSPTRSCGPTPKPVRVMSKKIADELTELMIGVVTERHRLPPARSPRPRSPARPAPPSWARSPARRTRPTRSRSRTPGSPPSPPPTRPKLAIGVLLIEAEAAGGEVAAPAAAAGPLGRPLSRRAA